MAGIGFELQRVLRRGGLGALFQVALSGIMIVAGPWLLSMAGIFVIGRFAGFALREGRELFMGVVIYGYAFSLILFGGAHYIFTRLVADLIYLEKKREAASGLLLFSALLALAAGAAAAAALSWIRAPGLAHPRLFKAGAALFFVAINLTWLLMIFISLLKRYLAISLAFLAGMFLSVAALMSLGRLAGLAGAMLGFTAGQLFTVVLLLALILREYRPGPFAATTRQLASYFPRYRFLFLSGLFYYWGLWIDKIVYWAALGQPVAGTFLRLFDLYDIPVYLANLTIIPGLIYFIVVYETGFFTALKEFLLSLTRGTFREIQKKKYRMLRELRTGLREQTLFQAVVSAVFLILAPALSRALFAGSLDLNVLRLTLLAVFAQLVFLTLVTFLFYFELYRESFRACLLFFLVNLAGSLATVAGGRAFYGASHLAGAAAGALAAAVTLFGAAPKADRRIFSR
jgi:uncharacterized membrane protein